MGWKPKGRRLGFAGPAGNEEVLIKAARLSPSAEELARNPDGSLSWQIIKAGQKAGRFAQDRGGLLMEGLGLDLSSLTCLWRPT
jgi:hypothetical protein